LIAPGAAGRLDTVEGADLIERLLGDRRAVGRVNIKELPPHVRPAGGFDNAAAFVEAVEPGIAVGVEHTSEVRTNCYVPKVAGCTYSWPQSSSKELIKVAGNILLMVRHLVAKRGQRDRFH
jgi:hypothetical protein